MLSRFPILSRFVTVIVLAAGALLALPPSVAQARVFFGVGFGFPLYAPFYPYYGPRVVYAPPYYYPPPVVYAAPPTYAAVPAGRCFAGAYVCPLDRPGPVGAPCSCPTNTGRTAGRTG
jgi:hypothetical protein